MAAPLTPAPTGARSLTDDAELGAHPFGECEVGDDTGWQLRLRLRAPTGRHLAELAGVAAKLPAELRCGRHGEVYLTLTSQQARELFGAHLTLTCVPGAGNSLDASEQVAAVSPRDFVPASLRSQVSALVFDTDPKLEWIEELGACVSH
jgi:hypothetical protein